MICTDKKAIGYVTRLWYVYAWHLCIYIVFIILQENEMVVQKALEEFGTKYVLDFAMPEWEERGLAVFDGGQKIMFSYLICQMFYT